PIRDTPLENAQGTPEVREHRLYQADHLIRRYHFTSDELVFDDAGNLPHAHDPKLTWALAHPELFPMDVQRASYDELLRVPGIGPLVARRIVETRRRVAFRGVSDLRKLGAVMTRAKGFLTLGGRRLAADRWCEQLSLWSPESRVGRSSRVYEF